MIPAASETPTSSGSSSASEPRLRLVLDDDTVERLRTAAQERGMSVEELMAELLRRASDHVDVVLAFDLTIDEATSDEPG